ncbi:MAG: phospholipase D-like domain-containing protein [Terriglobia bacterium]
MLELEERQSFEHQFQESLGGGPIGWVLRHSLIGNGVPVQLWVPDGLTGDSFARLVDQVVATNPKSGWSYFGKKGTEAEFIDSGESYYKALVELIDDARDFLNIQQFDWKLDRGGKEVTYRLMAKKLGLTASEFDSLVEEFREGIRLNPGSSEKTAFFDIPPAKMRNLLFFKLFSSSEEQPFEHLRHELKALSGERFTCPSVESCGDLSKVYQIAGSRYDARRQSDPAYQSAWAYFRDLEFLFRGQAPTFKQTKPRRCLSDYLRENSQVQNFVRQYGLKRSDNRGQPFDINIIADGKQDLPDLQWFHFSKEIPYLYSHPSRELHNELLAFDVKVLLWKGVIEYPWHVGSLPIGGRWIGGKVPFVYVPYPWLHYVPGFGSWLGIVPSLVFQHLISADVRTWWAMISHAKSVSSESTAMESGFGFASKYFNLYSGFRTWHDTGILARGPVVKDVNDRFVQEFNRARTNNRGIPESNGVKIPVLNYSKYRSDVEELPGHRSWVLTTNTEGKDFNYRGVFMAALAGARHNIYIENVYFSDPLISRMLIRKAREFRGRVNCSGLTDLECMEKKQDAVKVYLILPENSDRPTIDLEGRSRFYEMINEGVKVYRWNPRNGYASQKLLHTKAWLVDYEEGKPALAYVGSHNADKRSLWADNEIGILSTSPEFAKSLYDNLFLQDLDQDSSVASRSSFHIERLMNPGRGIDRLVRMMMVDLSWFF